MKLITDWSPLTTGADVIKESREKNGGKIILKGILQKADTLNQNGRIYPMEILSREIRNYQKLIKENRSTGELDHPAESVISLKNVSHIIRSAYFDTDGKTVLGSLEVLSTPSGKILENLISDGVTIGISSRGVGSTAQEGEYQKVQDDFQLIAFDMVSDPSTPNAFMMKEGRELSENDLKKVFKRSDRINRIVNDILTTK